MQLTDSQLENYHRNGFLVVPGVFNAAEVQAMRDESVAVFSHERLELWREKNGAPRPAFG